MGRARRPRSEAVRRADIGRARRPRHGAAGGQRPGHRHGRQRDRSGRAAARGQAADGRRRLDSRTRSGGGPAVRVKPPLPRLHAITDDAVARRPDLDAIARGLSAGGGEHLAFHARGHGLSGREVFELATRLTVYPPSLLFVNDRLDVALATGATGVQLGRGSLRPEDARRCDPEWWIGVSVHDLEEAESARDAGADYLLAGPVYATASHPDRSPLGLTRLEEIIALGVTVI